MVSLHDQILFIERELRLSGDLASLQPNEILKEKSQKRVITLEEILKTLTTVYEKEFKL